MTALATLDDLAAIGGVAVNVNSSSPEGKRAERLLGLAESAVLCVAEDCDVTAEVIEEWPDHRKGALTAVVVELAAKRLTAAAAPNVDQIAYGSPSFPQTLRLTKTERRNLLEVIYGATGNWPQP